MHPTVCDSILLAGNSFNFTGPGISTNNINMVHLDYTSLLTPSDVFLSYSTGHAWKNVRCVAELCDMLTLHRLRTADTFIHDWQRFITQSVGTKATLSMTYASGPVCTVGLV